MRHVQPRRLPEHAVQLDEVHLPVPPLVREQVVAIEDRETFPVRLRLVARQEIQLIHTVNDPVLRNRGAGDAGQGRQHVNHVHDLVTNLAGLDFARPTHDRRHPERAFQGGEVVAPPISGGAVIALDLFRAVVAQPEHDGLVANSQIVDGIQDLAGVMVNLL